MARPVLRDSRHHTALADHGRRRAPRPVLLRHRGPKELGRALTSVEENGGKPYASPAGASDHPLGGLGFARWADEVAGQERELARIVRFTAEAIGLGRELDDSEIVLLDEWHAGTYGSPDEKTIAAIRLCAGNTYLFRNAKRLKQQPLIGARLAHTSLALDQFVEFFYLGPEAGLQSRLCALAGLAR